MHISKPRGTGPGVITADGCAVELYARLPAGREPGVIHDAIAPGATILELGCGTGRVTHPLIALGHAVTAVDESPEMLERVRGAETVRARVEELELGDRTFGAVVMGSHLINTPFDDQLAAWLATCRRYVAPDGCVLIEQWPPQWFEVADDRETERGGLISRFRDVSRPGPGLVSATVEYRQGDDLWTQAFTARRLDDPAMRQLLHGAGLALDGYLTDDHAWFRAVPA